MGSTAEAERAVQVLASEELRKRGHTVDDTGARYTLVDNVPIYMECRMGRTGSMYFSEPTGDVRIVVGETGNQKAFPKLKAGGYNWDLFEQAIRKEVARVKTEKAANTLANQNRYDAMKLRKKLADEFWPADPLPEAEEFGDLDFHAPQVVRRNGVQLTLTGQGLKLSYELTGATEEQARVFIEALQKAGIA